MLVALASIFGFVASNFKPDGTSVYAKCTTVESKSSTLESKNPLLTQSGIPFAIFTGTQLGSEYTIVDYNPEFTKSGKEDTMVASSIPYVFLSSKIGGTVLYVTFNTVDMENVSGPPSIAGLQAQITVKTTEQSNPIQIQSNIVGETNQKMVFALDLQPDATHCPQLAGQTSSTDPTDDVYLGNVKNIGYRTGLWEFNITYMVKYEQQRSSAYTLKFSFYVLNFADYTQNDNPPLAISNANTLYANSTGTTSSTTGTASSTTSTTSSQVNTGYSVYNYNYATPPIVAFDASKYALSFNYSAGNNFYNMNFVSFEETGADSGTTGKITLSCNKTSATYVFETHKEGDIKYKAVFDFDDFEKKFIIPNSTALRTSTMQGIYNFNLQVVARDSEQNFQVLDSASLTQSIRDVLSSQKLVIFGYDLRYSEDGTEKSLEKYSSSDNINIFTTIASYNSTTTSTSGSVVIDNTKGNRYSLPSVDGTFAIAKTNMAPLRFHSFGTMPKGQAKFILINNQTKLNEIKDYLFGIQEIDGYNNHTIEELKTYINNNGSTYNRFSAITSDGIWLMWLDYSTDVPYTDESGDVQLTISGSQCVLFQIDNSTQTLGVHSISYDSSNQATTAHLFGEYTQDKVRVAIKKESNTFNSPIYVRYRYASDYKNYGTKSTLILNESDSYTVDGVEYNYYVTNTGNDYTFQNSGAYVVTLETSTGTAMGSYSFKIDKAGFENIGVYEAVYNSEQSSYIKSTKLSAINNLYVTNKPFTFSWANKASGAQTSCYVAYMGLVKDNSSSATPVILDGNNNERYITNNYNLSSLAKNIETNYKNSINQTTLEANSYFKNEGLYFFYVYDECGNSFSICVLVDNTSPEILQRKRTELQTNMFDLSENPNNFQTEDNILYFGTHKAIGVATKDDDEITILNSKYLASYNIETGEYINTQSRVTFNFYEDVLSNLEGYYITSPKANSDTTKTGTVLKDSYIVLENELLSYYVNNQLNRAFNPNSASSKTSSVTVYAIQQDGEIYSGENDYLFVVKNKNGNEISRELHVNFDTIKGYFSASSNSSTDKHNLSNNSATNLDLLNFEFTMPSRSDTSQYYAIHELYYEYYPYVYSTSNTNFSEENYPYSKNSTKKVYLTIPTSTTNKYTISNINIEYISQKGTTAPGKYVLTRVLRGGPYADTNGSTTGLELDSDGKTYYGGKYYKNSSGEIEALPLLKYDDIVRTYTVYVDRNGIIEEENGTRIVGDNIKITLGDSDGWVFNDFLKKSNSYLLTNKLPVILSVPAYKYFIPTNNSYIKANYSFAKLNVTVEDLTRGTTYVADGIDSSGYCTCTAFGGEFVFKSEGKYKIKITDNTGYNNMTTGERNVSPSTLEYTFEISTSAPQVDFYATETDRSGNISDTKLQSELGNYYCINTANSDENNVYATWSDPRTPYEASIDKIEITKILNGIRDSQIIELSNYNKQELAKSVNYDFVGNNGIKSFIRNFEISYFGGSNVPYIYDGKTYYRFTYKLSLDITDEATYEISFTYKDAENYVDASGYAFASTYYTLKIDRTKPNTNIDNLLSNETFLNGGYFTNISEFKEENFNFDQFESKPSPLTYSFGISNNFTLQYNANDTANYFYVRKYNKYQNSYSSITPDMKNSSIYSNSKFAQYPKFSEEGLNNGVINIENETYYKVYYSNDTLSKQLTSLSLEPYGHFEIIEKDYAGNYRAYTVYIPQSNSSNVLHFAGKDLLGASISNTLDSDITLRGGFEMTSLYSDFGWGVATITNGLTNTSLGQILLTPFSKALTSETRNALKQEFSVQVMTKFTISLSRHNSLYSSVAKSINIIPEDTDIKLDAPEINSTTNTQTGETYYSLTLPYYNSGSALYLDRFELQSYSQSSKKWEQTSYVYSGKITESQKVIQPLSYGIYKAIYHDNYNTGDYYYILYVGEYYIKSEDEMFRFSSKRVIKDDTYYTGDNVNVTYEANLYKVTVNGVLYSGTSNEWTSANSTLASYGCKTFTLYAKTNSQISASSSIGGEVSYVIDYYDILEGNLVKTVNVVINNYLPEIMLKNASDDVSEITSTLQENSHQITNSAVQVDWGYITEDNISLEEVVEQGVTAKLYFKDTDGKYKLYANLSRGQIVEDGNYYRLDLINEVFGISRSVYFIIQYGELPLYSVESNGQTLSPSPAENLNLTLSEELYSAYYNDETTQSNSIINILYRAMSENKSLLSLDNITSSNKTDFDVITRNMGFVNGEFSTNNISATNVMKLYHYYSIYDMQLTFNSNIQLKVIEFNFKNNVLQSVKKYDGSSKIPSTVYADYYTTIYLVYFLGGPIKIELFATTKTPKTSNLLSNNITFGKTSISLDGSNATELVLAGDQLLDEDGNMFESLNISWNSLSPDTYFNGAYWFRQGNTILLNDVYGIENYEEYPTITYSNDTSTCHILPTGEHTLAFRDVAGNTHRFQGISSIRTYKLLVLDKVDFYLNYNGQTLNAIDYAVFNNEVSLVINDSFSKYYDINKIQIAITRNGTSFTSAQIASLITNNTLTFTTPGRYTVTFDGSYNNKAFMSNVYNFTLISSTASSMAFEYPEIVGYQIEQVLRDNEDITSSFMSDGKVKSLLISSDDSRSGNGSYTVTLRYGSAPHQTLEFSFLISDFIPTLSCNIAFGETTTSNIVISFNADYIYNQLGDCEVKIMVYNSDSNTFYQYNKTAIKIDKDNLGSARKITLTASNSYFIQVETASGNVLTSFRVNKKDPLNFFAIVSIIVGVIVLVVVTIIIIKLRTRMRVR